MLSIKVVSNVENTFTICCSAPFHENKRRMENNYNVNKAKHVVFNFSKSQKNVQNANNM